MSWWPHKLWQQFSFFLLLGLFGIFVWNEGRRALAEARTRREPVWLAGPRAVDRGLARVEEVVLSVLLAALMLLGVYQAIRRNVLPRAISFNEGRIYIYLLVSGGAAAAIAGWRYFVGSREHKAAPLAAFGLAASAGTFVILALHVWVFWLEKKPLLADSGIDTITGMKIGEETLPQNGFWVDELIRYSVFFIGLVGGALAAQAVKLINIDMLTRLFGVRGKLVLRLVTAAFTILVCWLLIEGGLVVRAINHKLGEGGEVIKPETAILALPIGAGLVGLHLALHAVVDFYYLIAGGTPPDLENRAPPT